MGSKRCASPSVLILAGVALAGCAAASRHEMRFWVSSFVEERDARRKHVEAHSCGAVTSIWVERLPPFDPHADFQPEQIFEFDAAGREVRRWSSSVDAGLVAARGDEILVEFSGRQYWIATNGRLTRNTSRLSSTRQEDEGQCPHNGPNDFCSIFTDIETKAERTFSHPSVCT